MPLSGEFHGDDHPATHDRPKSVETEFREIAPGQFGHVAVRGDVVVPQRAQFSEIAHGKGDESVMSFGVPTIPERNQSSVERDV